MNTDNNFDLIVVGAGLSGLAAAYYWCTCVEASARILLIEASARIGGSSVCHTSEVGGHTMFAPGGAQELVFPSSFSSTVKSTLEAIGIDIDDLATRIDPTHYAKRGAQGHAFCFSRGQWQRDGIAIWSSEGGLDLSDAPLCKEAKDQLSQIFSGEIDWFEDLNDESRLEALRSRSCTEVLTDFGNCHDEVKRFFAYSTSSSSGLPFNLHPALDAALVGYPPMGALAPTSRDPWPGLTRAGRQFFSCESPVTYRFPDGNATIARAFLAWLRPDVFKGRDIANRLGETADAGKLRDPTASRRLHLNETVTSVSPVDDKQVVIETTTTDGRVARYRSSAAILAGWASTMPSLVTTLSASQKATASAMGRLPLITATVTVSNWKAWKKLGISTLSWPGHQTWQRAELGFPVTLGSHSPPDSPDQPNVITVIGATTTSDCCDSVAAAKGRDFLNQPNQAAWLQDELVQLLANALGPAGFDVQSELLSCKVELWPNGYSRYSHSLDYRDDSVASAEDKRALARGVGPIAIAGADVSDHPFLDGAIEAAFDAVSRLREPHLKPTEKLL